jgi:hypothetical protein
MPCDRWTGALLLRKKRSMMTGTHKQRLSWSLLAGLAGTGITAQIAAYWPGIMIWDAIRQYGQAISGRFDDWHPPAFEWLWRQFLPIHDGPAPMLILQLVLYWGGFLLLGGWALSRGKRGLAVGVMLAALLPIPFALIGAVLKDSLMAGLLLTATGLLAWHQESGKRPLRIVAIFLLLFAATLRFNAFVAGLPLLVALLPLRWRNTPARLMLTTLIAAIPLVMAVPVANRLLRAERSGVELSLIIFDLGGITYHSGVDAFPPQPITDPVAVNRLCYAPDKWDRYAWWGPAPCPIGFETIRAALKARHQSAYATWIGAIVAHPIAYAEHRLRHFNQSSYFLVRGEIPPPVFNHSDPNMWNEQVRPNAMLAAIDHVAAWSARTPIGWPIWWMAMAAGVLTLSPFLPSRRLIVPIALSALLYGLGYLVVGVASEMRYHLWTMTGTLLATILATGDLLAGANVPRRRLMCASAPVVLVTILAIGWRLL